MHPVIPSVKRSSGFSIDSLISKDKPHRPSPPPRPSPLLRPSPPQHRPSPPVAPNSPPSRTSPSVSINTPTSMHPSMPTSMPHPAFLNATTTTMHPMHPMHPGHPGHHPHHHHPHHPLAPHEGMLPPGMDHHMLAAAAAAAAQQGGHPGLHGHPLLPPGLCHPGAPHPMAAAAAAAGIHPGLMAAAAAAQGGGGGHPKDSFPFYTWLLSRHSSYLGHRMAGPEAYLFPFRKPKRIRTAFSPTQLLQLEHAFEKNHYVVGQERKDLAVALSLTETQVKVWFQNRRTKHKRGASEDGDDRPRGSGNLSDSENVDVDTYIDSPLESDEEDEQKELNVDVV